MDLFSFLLVLVLYFSWFDNIVCVRIGNTCDYVLERDDICFRLQGQVHLGGCLSLDFHHELIEWVDLFLLNFLQRGHLLVVLLLIIDTPVFAQFHIITWRLKFEAQILRIRRFCLGSTVWRNEWRLWRTNFSPFWLLLFYGNCLSRGSRHARCRIGGRWRRWHFLSLLFAFTAVIFVIVEFHQSGSDLPHGYLPQSFLLFNFRARGWWLSWFFLPYWLRSFLFWLLPVFSTAFSAFWLRPFFVSFLLLLLSGSILIVSSVSLLGTGGALFVSAFLFFVFFVLLLLLLAIGRGTLTLTHSLIFYNKYNELNTPRDIYNH